MRRRGFGEIVDGADARTNKASSSTITVKNSYLFLYLVLLMSFCTMLYSIVSNRSTFHGSIVYFTTIM